MKPGQFEVVGGIGPLAHVGIAVPDMDRAKALFTGFFGCRWALMGNGAIPMRIDGRQVSVPLQAYWTVAGPPDLELICAPKGTLWYTQDRIALHHMAYWVDDFEATSARLSAAGFPLELTYDEIEDRVSRFAYHRVPDGPRIELIDARRRAALEERVRANAENRS